MKLSINNRKEHLNAMNLNRVPAYCLYVAVMVMLCRDAIYIAPTYIIILMRCGADECVLCVQLWEVAGR